MAQASLSDEACQQAADAFARFGSQRAAADSLGISRSTFQHRINEAERRGFMGDGPRMVMRGQSVLYDAQGNERGRWDKTRLAGRPEADTVQLPDPKRITKTSRLFDQTGAVIQQWVSEKADEAEREALWKQCAEDIAAEVKRAKPVARGRHAVSADVLAVYPVGDHHVGMLAWSEETGGESYDLSRSEQLLADASQRLIEVCPPSEQALIAFLGDFLHYDSYSAVTPMHKNLLDADGRFPKMIRVAVRMVRHMIAAALARHGNIRVIFEKGNHDPATAAFMTVLLGCLYENEPRVSVDTSPQHFHYYEFGRVLIGTHHGDKAKLQQLPAIMATDQPEAWGRTSYRLWLTGHVHHEAIKEFLGCHVETLGVLPPADAYAASNGYRSRQSMKAIVFHREHGEVERHTVNPGMFSARAAA
jgi:predicted DNA-binding transcriptional regulator AlpA